MEPNFALPVKVLKSEAYVFEDEDPSIYSDLEFPHQWYTGEAWLVGNGNPILHFL